VLDLLKVYHSVWLCNFKIPIQVLLKYTALLVVAILTACFAGKHKPPFKGYSIIRDSQEQIPATLLKTFLYLLVFVNMFTYRLKK
jgi:hypothetical protein